MTNTLMQPEMDETKPRERGKALILGVLIALAVGNIFAIWQTSRTQSRLDELNSTLQARISTLSQQTSDYGASAGRAAAMLKDDVEQAKQAAAAAADQAKKQAEKRAEQLVNQLANQYKMENSAMNTEIGHVKDSATQANQDVIAVKTDVNGVRGDVTRTRTELDQTRRELTAELGTVKGDLGVQSGLIATNAEQLEALRELGERHYFEFQLPKDDKLHKVGSIAVVVKNTKPKQGKFTLDVIADDVRVEKKNRTINEPVQFYVSGSRQPYELVINEVHKDQIIGYLAVPKVLRAAR